MRNTAMLIMAAGISMILVAAITATHNPEESVTETVVPKSGATQRQANGESEAPIASQEYKSAGEGLHPGAVAHLPAFDADGQRLGDVVKVIVGPDGRIQVIHLEVGGFLGLGSRVVAIPHTMFAIDVDRIRVSLSAEVVEQLPEVKDDAR